MKGFIVCFVLYLFVVLFAVCSKADNPVEPIPPDPTPCEPVPCDPVPCEVVRQTGVWIITWGNPGDTSAPNSGGLLHNDKLIWSIVDSVPRTEELVIRVTGNWHPDDEIEAFTRGSGSRLRYRFEVREE